MGNPGQKLGDPHPPAPAGLTKSEEKTHVFSLLQAPVLPRAPDRGGRDGQRNGSSSTRERRRAPSPSDAAPGNAPARAARGAAPRNVCMAPGKLGRRSPKAEATPRSRDEQIHKIRFVYTVKYYSALKREVFLFLFSILGFYWVFKISQVGLRGCLASE